IPILVDTSNGLVLNSLNFTLDPPFVFNNFAFSVGANGNANAVSSMTNDFALNITGFPSSPTIATPFLLTQAGFNDVWQSETVTISVTERAATTPLPTALPLFATGLGALGLLGWRRKRKAAA